MNRLNPNRARILAGLVLALLMSACSRNDAPLADRADLPRPLVFAVAPILNFSGAMDLDQVQAADLLASELTQFKGAVVLPVNRVLAILAAQGRSQIESPEHALQVAQAVGADAILVAGITEYDPYTPIVGLAVQMYMTQPAQTGEIDPDDWARQARPAAIDAAAPATRPVGQFQKIFHSAHEDVVDDLKDYADDRSENDDILGWKRYLQVQTLYLRFCWHQAIRDLFKQHAVRDAVLTR